MNEKNSGFRPVTRWRKFIDLYSFFQLGKIDDKWSMRFLTDNSQGTVKIVDLKVFDDYNDPKGYNPPYKMMCDYILKNHLKDGHPVNHVCNVASLLKDEAHYYEADRIEFKIQI